MTALPPDVVADLRQENARLQAELRAARDRQAGSAEILRAVANISGDAERPLQQIAETTARLFGASSVTLRIAGGDEWSRTINVGPSAKRIGLEVSAAQLRIGARNLPGTVVLENRQIHVPDIFNVDPAIADWPGLPPARAAGSRVIAGTPLRRDGKAIGALIVHRDRPEPFTAEELALQQSFADQAVIAIENARLFNETQEALERQTATAEILKVIAGSPSDVQPVFEAIAESAKRLSGGHSSTVTRVIGDMIHLAAFTAGSEAGNKEVQSSFPTPLSSTGIHSRVARAGEIAFRTDMENEPDVTPAMKELARARGYRSILVVPMLREGVSIGTISVTRRDPGPFADNVVNLLQTFADQAVIAIENARLFNETREALERQTATAEILKVIASSPSHVQPVFEAIVANADRLIGGFSTGVYRFVDGVCHLEAFTPINPAADEILRTRFPRPVAGITHFELAQAGEVVEITDTETQADLPLTEIARARGFRSLLYSPLKSKGTAIGVIVVSRRNPGPFSAHHVQLLQTFADQAVIAIENVRLFNETREALERQTATADILKVIASSPSDVQPVFDVIVERAVRLCGGRMGRVYRYDGDVIQMVAGHGLSAPGLGKVQQVFPRPVSDDTIAGQVMQSHRPYFVTDIQHDDSVPPLSRQMIEALGTRSQVTVPMLRAGEAIGAITVGWADPGAFGDQQVGLLQTFADQAVIAIENVRLFNETKEALERQTATADILKVIASSPSDVQPVFEAIATSSNRLIGGFSTAVLRFIGDELHLAAFTPTNAAADEALQASFPRPLAEFPPFMLVRDGETVQFVDTEAEGVPQLIRDLARLRGYRSMLFTPLMSGGTPIGLISVTRAEPGTFAAHHMQLVRTFADQAVIAIENVRLFDEVQAKTRDLTEALTYQTGSSNILSVIASSPTDVAPVLKAIVESACKLCEAYDAVVLLKDGNDLRFSAHHGPIPINIEKWPINRNWSSGRAFVDQKPVHVRDLLSDEGTDFPDGRELSQHTGTEGVRSILSVPLLRENESVGAILLRRTEVHPFSDKQIALLQTFADQAVIAIGNVRLFDEVQAKTRDLTESLEQQTATSEVLEVISSSPGELEPVFQKMLENATRICGANFGAMNLYDGDRFQNVALYNVPHVYAEQMRVPIRPHPKSGLGTVARTHQAIQIEDLRTQPPYLEGDPAVIAMSDLAGARTIVIVPMLRENELVGTIAIYRQEVRSFTGKQVDLVANFAKQAVIAIENTRLLKELRQRTDDLGESLQFQTATSDVLKVISSSPDTLQPVLDVIVDTSRHLCGTETSTIFLLKDGQFHIAAASGTMPEYLEFLRANPIALDQAGSSTSRAAREKRTVHIPDIGADPEFGQGPMGVGQRRALLSVPLMREGTAIGVITMRQSHLTPFTERQIEVVQTFADQAVIAISNVRLFEEVQARTRDLTESLRQQTATADVLRVISASPGELEPVFQAMLENAVRLCEAEFAMLFLYEENEFRAVGKWNLPPAYGEFLGKNPIRADPKIPLGRVAMTKQPVQISDVLVDQSYIEGFPGMVGVAELGGARTLLQVPMLKENELVGTIGIYRQEVRPFTDKQIALVQNFAAQAVIAIENARLLNELRQRTDDLTASLDDLRTAQDRLVQTEKLASLGQLTAGIAHEIKNPLNFVNNFSALSAELTDELNDVLKSVKLADNIREEVDELTGLLKDNLGKVVQHGKRADSIVKNMLLHSREGSGDHRPADINALVDESLNLAYHGARAEKPQFNVTLQRNLDPNAGMIEVFPQEITRVFLNLISNGFYAVTKRKVDNGGAGFEPVVSATTKDRGDQVEIRIRDNGTGIPPEVMEKMFNPFFTTKPAGEGTGLGLSMSHDIIVKQHGGTIDVETEPGQFTEFRIVLPRTSNISNKSRG